MFAVGDPAPSSGLHLPAGSHLPQPRQVRELVNLWFAEAGANQAFPLDDRSAFEIFMTPRPLLTPGAQPVHLLPRSGRRPRIAGCQRPQPLLCDRRAGRHPHTRRPRRPVRPRARLGGHALYIKDNRLHYVYDFVGSLEQKVVGSEDIPTGENLILSPSFDKQGEDPPGVARGTLSLYHGDKKVGEAAIKTQPGKFVIGGEGLCTGTRQRRRRDRRLPKRDALALHRRHH